MYLVKYVFLLPILSLLYGCDESGSQGVHDTRMGASAGLNSLLNIDVVQDEQGKTISLAGFSKSELLAGIGVITSGDVAMYPGEDLFVFAPKAGATASFSQPQEFTTASLTAESCSADLTYSDAVPHFSDLPSLRTEVFFCIQLTLASGSGAAATAVYATPTFLIDLQNASCRDPDLDVIAAGTEVTLCDGSTGVGRYDPDAANGGPPKPSLAFNVFSAFGPANPTAGVQTSVTGTATVGSGSIATVTVKVEEQGGGGCLASDKSAFGASCDETVAAWVLQQGSGYTFQLDVPDARFTDGKSYSFSATAVSDKDISSEVATTTLTWDATAPAAPANLTATAIADGVQLDWDDDADAASYLIFRKAGVTVGFLPDPMQSYSVQQDVGSGTRVVYTGGASGASDLSVTPYVRHAFQVFAVDASGNISAGVTATAAAFESPRFRGIAHAAVYSTARDIHVSWEPAADATQYKVYTATTSQGFDFDAAPVATSTGNFATFRDAGAAATLYLAVRADTSGDIDDENTREFALNFGTGTIHKIGRNGRSVAVDPDDWSARAGVWATAADSWGNTLFGGTRGVLEVHCAETSEAPYCAGKTKDRIYTIAGKDGSASQGATGPAAQVGLGYLRAIAVDASGNIFVGDSEYSYVKALCFAPHVPGLCFEKTYGHAYTVAGTGTAGNGGNDVVASSTAVGDIYGLAVSAAGDLFLADYSYYRIRVICGQDQSGFCQSKTIGNMYHFSGTGSASDGGDNAAGLTTPMGRPTGVALDSHGNVFIADYSYYRIRAHCQSVAAGSGFCAGRTAGNVYHLAGTGSSGNAGDDVTAATAAFGRPYGIAVDSPGNIYFSDPDNFALRVACQDNTSSLHCDSSRATGNLYTFLGVGAQIDGSDTALVAAGVGGLRQVAVDGFGNVFAADSTYYRIRAGCQTTSGYCSGKSSPFHYRLTGGGTSSLGGQYTLALTERLGSLMGSAVDPQGNIFISDTTARRVSVVCMDVVNAGVCQGRTIGHVYYVAGIGSQGDGTDGLALGRAMGSPYGLASDSGGNIFIADYTYRRVRAICLNTSVGWCNGKTLNHSYRVAGTGSSGSGGDDVDPLASNINRVYDVAVDSEDNIYFVTPDSRRSFVVCVGNSQGACSGRTIGQMYYLSGTGAQADGADNAVATAAAHGHTRSLAIDANDNVYLGDYTYERIRVICHDVAAAGYCNGRTAQNIYRMAGTGTAGNGADDAPMASTAMGAIYAVAVDSHGNVFAIDTYERLRLACTSTSGFCSGRTVNNVYRFGGEVFDSDGASNIPVSTSPMGNNGYGGLSVTPSGALVRVGNYYTLRLILP